MKPTVSVARCESYDYNKVSKALDRSIDLLGGWQRFVKKGNKVLIKPNLLAPASPEKAVCTHPAVVEAIIEKVVKHGGIPFVGDSPGTRSAESIAETCGIKEVCKRRKVRLIELSDPVWKSVGAARFPVSRRLDEFDLIINVPKLKTHMLTVYTGAVKNLFGCIPGILKGRYHLSHPSPDKFSSMLLDLYTLIEPKLTIMDGVIGMEGLGPGNGTRRLCGLIISGDNSLAVDVVAARAVNLQNRAPMFSIAKQRKMTGSDLADINLKGEKLGNVLVKKFKRPPSMLISLYKLALLRSGLTLARKLLSQKPVIGASCTSCGDCYKICPSHAIKMNKTASINYGKCIKCFCCYEVCTYSAVGIKGLFGLKKKAGTK